MLPILNKTEESLLPTLQETLTLSGHAEDSLFLVHEEDGASHEPKIICSMGLVEKS